MTSKTTVESTAHRPMDDGEQANETTSVPVLNEVERLEQLLRERAREVRALRDTQEWEGALVRELARRLGAVSQPLGLAEGTRLISENEAAQARAVEAEAGRVELAFRVHELQGQLLEATARQNDELVLSEARLSGTSRGLRAALAETEEARDVAQARVLLLDDDFQDANEQISTLRRQLQKQRVEAQEQVELLRLQTVDAKAEQAQTAIAEQAKIAAVSDQHLRDDNALLRSLLTEVRRELVELSGADGASHDGRGGAAPVDRADVATSEVAGAAVGADQDTPSLRPVPIGEDVGVEGQEDVQVRALQRELATERSARSRERDVRSEERKGDQAEMTRLTRDSDEMRARLEAQASGKRVAIRQARVLLDHVAAGDPLAQEVGLLLEQLET